MLYLIKKQSNMRTKQKILIVKQDNTPRPRQGLADSRLAKKLKCPQTFHRARTCNFETKRLFYPYLQNRNGWIGWKESIFCPQLEDGGVFCPTLEATFCSMLNESHPKARKLRQILHWRLNSICSDKIFSSISKKLWLTLLPCCHATTLVPGGFLRAAVGCLAICQG